MRPPMLRSAGDSHPGLLPLRWFDSVQRGTSSQRVVAPVKYKLQQTNKWTENWFRCRRIWHNDGRAGWSVFPNRYLLSRAAVGRQTKQVVWSCFHCICSRLFRISEMPFWRPRFFVQRLLQKQFRRRFNSYQERCMQNRKERKERAIQQLVRFPHLFTVDLPPLKPRNCRWNIHDAKWRRCLSSEAKSRTNVNVTPPGLLQRCVVYSLGSMRPLCCSMRSQPYLLPLCPFSWP